MGAPAHQNGIGDMDLNYYLERERVERDRADQARDASAALAHRGLAELYRAAIDRYRGGAAAVETGAPILR